jgi:hypothetical protein
MTDKLSRVNKIKLVDPKRMSYPIYWSEFSLYDYDTFNNASTKNFDVRIRFKSKLE